MLLELNFYRFRTELRRKTVGLQQDYGREGCMQTRPVFVVQVARALGRSEAPGAYYAARSLPLIVCAFF